VQSGRAARAVRFSRASAGGDRLAATDLGTRLLRHGQVSTPMGPDGRGDLQTKLMRPTQTSPIGGLGMSSDDQQGHALGLHTVPSRGSKFFWIAKPSTAERMT
jgi:hypothetical protein